MQMGRLQLEEARKVQRRSSRENLQEEGKWNQSGFWAETTSA